MAASGYLGRKESNIELESEGVGYEAGREVPDSIQVFGSLYLLALLSYQSTNLFLHTKLSQLD